LDLDPLPINMRLEIFLITRGCVLLLPEYNPGYSGSVRGHTEERLQQVQEYDETFLEAFKELSG